MSSFQDSCRKRDRNKIQRFEGERAYVLAWRRGDTHKFLYAHGNSLFDYGIIGTRCASRKNVSKQYSCVWLLYAPNNWPNVCYYFHLIRVHSLEKYLCSTCEVQQCFFSYRNLVVVSVDVICDASDVKFVSILKAWERNYASWSLWDKFNASNAVIFLAYYFIPILYRISTRNLSFSS